MSVKNKTLHITGSASPNCDRTKLAKAHQLVRILTWKLLKLEASVVVCINGDPLIDETDPNTGKIFDWDVVEATDAFVQEQENQRKLDTPRIIVVTTHEALNKKISTSRRELLKKLSENGILHFSFISDEMRTGGNFRDEIIKHTHGLIVISGGRGVSDISKKLQNKRVPILPFDLNLGSSFEDGGGAVLLNKQAHNEPTVFFPSIPQQFSNTLLNLSLESEYSNIDKITSTVVSLFLAEFAAQSITQTIERFDIAILTALPIELDVVRASLEINDTYPKKTDTGTNYWSNSIDSRRSQNQYQILLACIGTAGNVNAGIVATEILQKFRPQLLIMVGIGAGIRGECKLGEVVFSERIYAYEPAALVVNEDGLSSSIPRPEQFRLSHSIHQDVTGYISLSPGKRLTELMHSQGYKYPEVSDEQKELLTTELRPKLATIASGEKLLRDPSKLAGLRKNQHGKIEVGEMEAVGIATTCEQHRIPYLVIRGISDFGDSEKDDQYHRLASAGAATVAVDFIREFLLL